MIHFFVIKNDHVIRTILLFLTAASVFPLSVSCSSKGMAPVSPKDPYADNAPKSKEEEDYYQDVYSGDWKKQMTNPLGYFGLGRYQVSTSPPPHWTMDVPDGAKSMEQIRQETYVSRMEGVSQMEGANRTEGASRMEEGGVPTDRRYASGPPYSDNPSKTAAAPFSSPLPDGLDGHFHDGAISDRTPSSPSKREGDDERGTEKSEKKEKEKKKSFFDGWTRFRPSDSDDSGATLENRQAAAAGVLDGESSMTAAGKSSAGVSTIRLFRGDSPILRGQVPSPQAGRSVTSTADSVSSPITIDPAIADPWRHVDGRGLTGASDRKDLPADEYIADGGDAGSETYAMPNWDVHNLESEETIAHFDTLGGNILVEPSNRVLIYSPRFGSVRQVVGPKSESQNVRLADMENGVALAEEQRREGIDYRTQETGIKIARENSRATGIGANQPGGIVSGEEGILENSVQTRLASAGGALREAVLQEKDRAAVADGMTAAAAWGEIQGVSVQIDRIAAQGNITLQGAETIYKIENETKSSRLRLIKVASKKEAAPGELVEFTIRFENVGTELIGNVTVLDSLSPRLEYVKESAKSSKKANFLVKNNETGSLLLRWEMIDPLEPNDFGVLTFLCKVR